MGIEHTEEYWFMNGEELATFALQRVEVHDGLTIDAAVWSAAHGYHQDAQRLHNRALHGWGIVSGLQVVLVGEASRTVALQPGIAIDRSGNIIRVAQPATLEVPREQVGTVCFALRFVEASQPDNGAARVTDSYRFAAYAPPLSPADLEVARVDAGDGGAPFRPAHDAWRPATNELDRRFRRELCPAPLETLTIGCLALDGGAPPELHRLGVINLVRELRATAPFAVSFLGDVRAEEAVGQCDLLYLCGAGEPALTPHDAALLLTFLRRGGILFAEPCVELETQRQENGRFAAAFRQVMAELKFELDEADSTHPLFHARYVFGAPPDGLGGHGPILSKGHVILNPNDYGCCWQGGPPGGPLPRETIRAAMELGVNAAWYAADQVSRRGQESAPGAVPVAVPSAVG